MKQLHILFIPFLVIALLLSSCNSYKKLTYLQDIGKDADTLYNKEKTAYRLLPGDILYIRLLTKNETTDRLFNPNIGEQGIIQSLSSENLYITGYEITDSGYIELPVIRDVFVQGLTIDQAKQKIEARAGEYIKDPQIFIKLHTFKFTILGEINSPGVKEYSAQQINVLEALALGGDITYSGNRQNIVILRPSEKVTETFRLDITDKNIVATENFYIQPNDVIYVEPLRAALFRERASDYLFYLTPITYLLSTVALILSITK
jgi:polysaccharide biosynthesis/export protein